jgi:maltokinase
MIPLDGLESLLPDFLARQRWFGAPAAGLTGVRITEHELFGDEWPVLLWTLVQASFADGTTVSYQVPVGARPLVETERFLEGKGRAFLGDLETERGVALVYDALVDPDLTIELLQRVAPEEKVRLVRPLNVEQSNTSVVFDERLILKFFRRIAEGPNPDVEATRELARVGFPHISAPVAEWSRGPYDLAVLRSYLVGGADGWMLAATSLRDLYDRRVSPAESGGDFAPEARRLAEVTAAMHAAMAEAFGTSPGDPEAWVDEMDVHLRRVANGGDALGIDVDAVEAMYARLRSVADAGPAIRVHGDFHLGQTMRTDHGWYVLDFEGEPARPLAERRRPSSPLKDVAGMMRSFHYAAQVGLLERGEDMDDELAALGAEWERRACEAFLDGYLDTDVIDKLLPADDASLLAVLDAFTLDKAVYEVGYELAHRPAWATIPLAAVGRLLG